MKWKTILGMTLVGVVLHTPAWTHHAAEGIISDEMWEDINSQLVEAESPHLIIFEDIMGSMRIDEAAEGGSMFLVSGITVDEADCGGYIEVILDVLEDIELDWVHDPNGDTAGAYTNTFMPLLFVDGHEVDGHEVNGSDFLCTCDDGESGCEIAFWEPIGSIGWSDDAYEIYAPEDAPGPKAQPNGD